LIKYAPSAVKTEAKMVWLNFLLHPKKNHFCLGFNHNNFHSRSTHHIAAMSVADPDTALASSLATALVPHFRDALQKNCAEEAAVLTLVAMSQGAALAAPTMETDGAKHVVRREITCMTYLRRLHVTSEMVRDGGAMCCRVEQQKTKQRRPTPFPNYSFFYTLRPTNCCPT
jgi:hypothetical protein